MKAAEEMTIISFLDLISCGLAAGLLLMLVAATNSPLPPGNSRGPTQVVCVSTARANEPREFGIRYRRYGDTEWVDGIRHVDRSDRHDSLAAPRAGDLRAWLVLPTGVIGEFQFQVYVRAEGQAPSVENADASSDIQLLLFASGDEGVVTRKEPIRWQPNGPRTGGFSQTVAFDLAE